MADHTIDFKIKGASHTDVYIHLMECDQNFAPDLSDRVDLKTYANKIHEKALTFEAWNNSKLIGLVAAYLNVRNKDAGYITNVSVIRSFMGRGIATRLIQTCVDYATENRYKVLNLEVNEFNAAALKMYNKIGFINCGIKDSSIQMQLTLNK